MANLMDLFIRVGIDDQATGKIGGITSSFSKVGSSIGKSLATAAKVGTAALTAVKVAAVGVAKSSIDAYAEHEQLVGGIETLYEDLSWDVGQNAAKAFQTAGLSANEYMSTAMSFAASLNQSLTETDGNIARSADLTDQAILDMADNANKMGTDMSMIQNAYQGFAKQNYTMLDNLKLGYGGTKEEMQRLIADAAELSDTVDAQSMSFANIVEAIHVVQTEMGITGTTAKEAAQTISGSVAAMKGAWQNLMVGMSDDSQSIDVLVDNFANSVETVADNIIPVVRRLVPRMREAFAGLLSKGFEALDMDFSVEGVKDKIGDVFVSACEKLDIEPSFEGIKGKGLELLGALGTGMEEGLPKMTDDLLDNLVKGLEFTEEHGPDFIKAAGSFVNNLIDGVQEAAKSEKWDGFFNSISESLEVNSVALSEVGGEIAGNIWKGMTEYNPFEEFDWGDFLLGPIGNVKDLFAGGSSEEQGIVTKLWDSFYDGLQSQLGGGAAEDMGNLEIGVDIIADTSAYTEATTEAKTQTDTIFSAPIHVSADFDSIVSEAQSAYNSIVSTFSKGVTIKANVEVSGGADFVKNVTDRNTGKPHAAAASGLDYVPFDGYVSMLHKGEAVLTANQAKKWRDGASGGVTIVQHINSVPQTPVQLAAATAAYFERARW